MSIPLNPGKKNFRVSDGDKIIDDNNEITPLTEPTGILGISLFK